MTPAHPNVPGVEALVPDDRSTHLRNRVSWGAILAGVAAALVVQLLLNILGVGIGASSLDASNTAENPSASGFSTTAGIWWTLSGIVASLVGGIVAGRLCGTSDDNTARWHGFVSWCVATLVLFYLLTSAVGGIIGGTFNALGSTVGAAGRGAASAVSGVAQNVDGDTCAVAGAPPGQSQRRPECPGQRHDLCPRQRQRGQGGGGRREGTMLLTASPGLQTSAPTRRRPGCSRRSTGSSGSRPGQTEGKAGGGGNPQGRRHRWHLRLRRARTRRRCRMARRRLWRSPSRDRDRARVGAFAIAAGKRGSASQCRAPFARSGPDRTRTTTDPQRRPAG